MTSEAGLIDGKAAWRKPELGSRHQVETDLTIVREKMNRKARPKQVIIYLGSRINQGK